MDVAMGGATASSGIAFGLDLPELVSSMEGVSAITYRAREVIYDEGDAVTKQLLALAQRFGVQERGAMRVPMDLTQEQFAQLVGTSRESVNKALCDFNERGWIHTDRDSILIRDSEPLASRTHGHRRPGGRPR